MQYIILAITALILIVNTLSGMRKRLSRALLRFATLLVAVVAAFFLAKAFSPVLAERFLPVLEQFFTSGSESLLQSNPDLALALSALAQMMVTPLLFVLCYIVMKLLTFVAYIFLKIFVKKTRTPLIGRLGGAACGFLCGLVGVLVFITPTLGYTDLLSRTVDETAALAETSAAFQELKLTDYNEKYIKPAANTPVAGALYRGIGSKLFSGLTTVDCEGKTAKLETEWFAVLHVAENASKLISTPAAQYGETESAAAHAMAQGVDESILLSSVSGGAFSGVSGAWLQNESFAGIAKPQMGDESVDIILNGFLRVFSTTNKDLIGKDLDFFADVFDLLIKHGVFAKIGSGSTDDLVVHLATSGFLGDARQLLIETPRMQPVVDSISDAGMRLLVRELGDPAQYLQQHGELMNNISNALKNCSTDGRIDVSKATDEINQALAAKSISVPAEATEIIATGLADEFTAEELATLSTAEITDRVVARLGSVENISALIQ